MTGAADSDVFFGITLVLGAASWLTGLCYLIYSLFQPQLEGARHELVSLVAWAEVILIGAIAAGFAMLLANGNIWGD